MSKDNISNSSQQSSESGESEQYLTFIMGEEEYGVDILSVQEIRGWEETTPVPASPNCVKGVINLRGTIIPIIDLRERFHLENINYDATTVVVVLQVEFEDRSKIMGIVVDAVSDVHDIKVTDAQDTPEMSMDADYVKGLATVDKKMIILLHASKLLDMKNITNSEIAG